jgi:hypothetical protein
MTDTRKDTDKDIRIEVYVFAFFSLSIAGFIGGFALSTLWWSMSVLTSALTPPDAEHFFALTLLVGIVWSAICLYGIIKHSGKT